MFSGGIDSTLLLYLIAKQYPKRTIHAVTAGTCGYVDYPIHIKYAQDVFDQIAKRVGYGIIDYHTIHYLDDKETHHCNEVMKKFTDIDCWAIGRNAAPPKGTIVTDCHSQDINLFDTCNLEHRKSPSGPDWTTQHNIPTYTPFMYLTKQEEIQIYKNEEIYSLIDYTRSCPKVWSLTEANDFVPHCGHCWWCLERKWGLME